LSIADIVLIFLVVLRALARKTTDLVGFIMLDAPLRMLRADPRAAADVLET
jgi:hypothetical protein